MTALKELLHNFDNSRLKKSVIYRLKRKGLSIDNYCLCARPLDEMSNTNKWIIAVHKCVENLPSSISSDISISEDYKYIDVVNDWKDNSIVWFRIRRGVCEAYVQYIDEYRDTLYISVAQSDHIFNCK